MVDYEDKIILGEICHICGRQPNAPRYDKTQSEAERNSYPNLMLLCPTHHKMIDTNVDKYTVSVLLKMKEEHEGKMQVSAISVPEEWIVDELIKCTIND